MDITSWLTVYSTGTEIHPVASYTEGYSTWLLMHLGGQHLYQKPLSAIYRTIISALRTSLFSFSGALHFLQPLSQRDVQMLIRKSNTLIWTFKGLRKMCPDAATPVQSIVWRLPAFHWSNTSCSIRQSCRWLHISHEVLYSVARNL